MNDNDEEHKSPFTDTQMLWSKETSLLCITLYSIEKGCYKKGFIQSWTPMSLQDQSCVQGIEWRLFSSLAKQSSIIICKFWRRCCSSSTLLLVVSSQSLFFARKSDGKLIRKARKIENRRTEKRHHHHEEKEGHFSLHKRFGGRSVRQDNLRITWLRLKTRRPFRGCHPILCFINELSFEVSVKGLNDEGPALHTKSFDSSIVLSKTRNILLLDILEGN